MTRLIHSFRTINSSVNCYMLSKGRSYTFFDIMIRPLSCNSFFSHLVKFDRNYCHGTVLSFRKYQNLIQIQIGLMTKPLSTLQNEKRCDADVNQLTLKNILQCSNDLFDELVAKHPRLKNINLDIVEEKVKMYLSYNLPIEYIHHNPRFLHNTSCDELSKRLNIFKERGLLQDLLGDQAVLNPSHFGHYMECSNSRFEAVFKKLCQQQDALEGYAGQKSLHKVLQNLDLNVSPSNIEEKVKIFLSFGLPLELIYKNPGFLRNTSSKVLSKRLEMLDKRGLLTDLMKHQAVLKVSVFVNCLEQANSVFLFRYNNLCKQQDALEGFPDLCAYLQFRLKTTTSVASRLMDSAPFSKKYSNVYLKEHLDFFLLEANLAEDFVIKNVELFKYSVERLRSRYLQLKHEGGKQPSEAYLNRVWRLSQKKFDAEFVKIE